VTAKLKEKLSLRGCCLHNRQDNFDMALPYDVLIFVGIAVITLIVLYCVRFCCFNRCFGLKLAQEANQTGGVQLASKDDTISSSSSATAPTVDEGSYLQRANPTPPKFTLFAKSCIDPVPLKQLVVRVSIRLACGKLILLAIHS
jgi:hypothetical protein